MIDLPTSSTFAAVVADPRFALAIGISVLSGAVRGFSGFGSALIYVPLMSALYGPKIGAASFLLTDFVTGIVFSIGVWRQAVWREIIPLALSAAVVALGIVLSDGRGSAAGTAMVVLGGAGAVVCIVLWAVRVLGFGKSAPGRSSSPPAPMNALSSFRTTIAPVSCLPAPPASS